MTDKKKKKNAVPPAVALKALDALFSGSLSVEEYRKMSYVLFDQHDLEHTPAGGTPSIAAIEAALQKKVEAE